MALPTPLVERLAGVKAKLDRAEELMQMFDADWDEWRDKQQPWGAETQVGDGHKRVIFSLQVREPVPLRFSVIAGETIHDIRSALDHLASYLVQLHGAQPTLVTGWPIEQSPFAWRRKVERRRHPWQLWRKKGGGPLKGIPSNSAAWALIRGSQPYIRSDKATDDPLWDLHQLWNTDKHRALHLLPLYTDPGALLDSFRFKPPIEPIERKALAPTNRPLKHGTKLALFRFAQSFSNMNVQFTLPLQVALGDQESESDRAPLRETLQIVRDLYETARALPYPP